MSLRDGDPELSERLRADLAALADGSLEGDRRAEVEAQVRASPELTQIVERQRRARDAVNSMPDEPVPDSLRARVEAMRPRSPRRWGAWASIPQLALGVATAAVVAVIALVLVLGGEGTGTSVAEAAQLTTKPPTAPAPRPARGDPGALEAQVEGVTFPDLARSHGWVASGLRRGAIDGRDALVVFYAKGQRRLAYMVVSGGALGGTSGYPTSHYRGVEFDHFEVGGRRAVTWLRHGHTCVLAGDATKPELLSIATGSVTGAGY